MESAWLPDLVMTFDQANQVAGLRVQTRERFYTPTLLRFLQWLEREGIPPTLTRVGRPEVQAYLLAQQRKGLSPATVRGYYRAIKRFFTWLVEEDYLEEDPLRKMRTPRVPKAERPIPSRAQVEALLAAAGGTRRHRLRDYALVLVTWDGDLRAGEVRSLRVDMIDWDWSRITVIGKGGKTRPVPLEQTTMQALRAYLQRSRQESPHPELFLGEQGRPLGKDGLQSLWKRLRAQTGLKARFHDLRHAGATRDALSGRYSPWQLQAKLGHESIVTTERYLHR
jgi:site-specific recombinase XerD